MELLLFSGVWTVSGFIQFIKRKKKKKKYFFSIIGEMHDMLQPTIGIIFN